MTMNFPVEQLRALRTPFYYYDMNLLQQTIDAVKEGIKDKPNYHVHYAVKANANPRVLKLIAENGFGTDSVSGGEIHAALEAGVPAHQIVFAGVGKADWEIELGIASDIYCFNVESVPELEVINELAQKADKKVRVAFRINPEVDAHTHANITTGLAENKFGIAMQDMLPVFQIASRMSHIEVIGLHFHIGSQITTTEPFKALALRVNELQQELAVAGFHVQDINVGGGLGIDYILPDTNPIPDFKAYFDTFAAHLDLREDQHVHCELGRSIVGQCGTMISKCLYLKEGVNRKFAILDAGFTELMRPALYQAVHVAQNITSPDAPMSTVDIVGPICESSDVFEKGATIPLPKRGDLIAFRSAGAYGEIMASTYNCRTLPIAYYSTDFE
ncbi:MAG TPA: diaminopimelate decarboxylase [Bacteroidaceae bacterium]|nr:diaminopimelate decarboxylase [Bacteroidaceae bacterium]